jgi:hypothetical protein
MRKAFGALTTNIPRPPFIGGLLPKFESVAGPVLLPTASGEPVPALKTPAEVLEALAPKLTREEELYALSIVDLAKQTLGDDAAVLISGDAVLEPRAAVRVLLAVLGTGRAPALEQLPPQIVSLVRQLLVAVNGGQAERSGAASGSANRDEAIAAIAKLDADERQVLASETQDLLNRLWDRILTRLAPMAGVSPPPPAAARPVFEQRQPATGRAAGDFRQGSSVMKTSSSQTLARPPAGANSGAAATQAAVSYTGAEDGGSRRGRMRTMVRDLDGTERPDLVAPPPPPKVSAVPKKVSGRQGSFFLAQEEEALARK